MRWLWGKWFGDGVFRLVAGALLLVLPLLQLEARADDAAVASWESIHASKDPAVFKEFVEKYPDHPFGQLADVRHTELTGKPLFPKQTVQVEEKLPAIRTDLNKTEGEWAEKPTVEELRSRFAYKTKSKAQVRSTASSKSKTLKTLEADTPVIVNGKEGDWYKVSLSALGAGFIHKSSIGENSIDWSWLLGVKNPSVEAIEQIKATPSEDCYSSPTRPCLKALIDNALSELTDSSTRSSALADVSTEFFRVGDEASGWKYFDVALNEVLAKKKSEYSSAIDNRVSALTYLAGYLNGGGAKRQAVVLLAMAAQMVPKITSIKEYYSDQEERFEAYNNIGSILLSYDLKSPANAIFNLADTLGAELPASGSDPAAENREDAMTSVASSYIYAGQMTTALRYYARGVEHNKQISYVGEYGLESITRSLNLLTYARDLASLGFIDTAVKVANQNANTEYRAEALADIAVVTKFVDPRLSRSIAVMAASEAKTANAGEAFAALISAGYVELAEKNMSISSIDESDRHDIGEAYVKVGQIDKATDVALSISDEDYREWVYDDIVSHVAKRDGVAAARQLAEAVPGVDNKDLLAAVDQAELEMQQEKFGTLLKEKKIDEAIAFATEVLAKSKKNAGSMLLMLMAHFVKKKDLDGAVPILGLAKDATPSVRTSICTSILKLVK